ncbi:MAG: hypothetical protein P0116_11450 [Candidatus Nitrosocosmicus sp.]|nr:hypothetical protein [Candidatus Nitrosocosmicus sp.]
MVTCIYQTLGSNTASVIDSPYTTPHLFEEEILRSGNHITVRVQFKSSGPTVILLLC